MPDQGTLADGFSVLTHRSPAARLTGGAVVRQHYAPRAGPA